MPPRWPRKPDRKDSAYRKLDDRMTFATHVATFSAINSGLWFFSQLQFCYLGMVALGNRYLACGANIPFNLY